MSECSLKENVAPGTCSRCERELKELRLCRQFILDTADALERDELSHTDAANEIFAMAEHIEEVGEL